MKSGWRQIGKHSAHFFKEGDPFSLCRLDYRGSSTDELLPDTSTCVFVCTHCAKRHAALNTTHPELFE